MTDSTVLVMLLCAQLMVLMAQYALTQQQRCPGCAQSEATCLQALHQIRNVCGRIRNKQP